MDIRTPTELARFISSNNLGGINTSFQQLIQCINTYSAWCNCEKKDEKEKLYVACKTLYSQSAVHLIPKYKTEFLLKTPDKKIMFYDDGRLISVADY